MPGAATKLVLALGVDAAWESVLAFARYIRPGLNMLSFGENVITYHMLSEYALNMLSFGEHIHKTCTLHKEWFSFYSLCGQAFIAQWQSTDHTFSNF